MNWIQLLLVIGLAFAVIYLVRARPSASHLALRRVFVIVAAIAGVVAVIWPGVLTWLAHLLGIGRGTDLLLYGLTIFVLIDSVSNYKRSVNHARTSSELARALALTEARLQESIDEMNEIKKETASSRAVASKKPQRKKATQ